MARASRNPPYRLLARYYDTFFTAHRSGYRRARREILGEVLRGARSACDLACGTGEAAVELARRGIAKVFAVDLSPDMCRATRIKAERAGVHVVVLQGDMRTFRLPEPVDLITCEYDAVNHVARKSDLTRVARAVSRALSPGGTFCFDVNNRLHLETVWSGTFWQERPGVVMVMRGSYDRRRAKGRTDVEWLIQEGACWRRFHEWVEEVWWTPGEICQALRAAGFGRIRAWDATVFFQDNPHLRAGSRTFYAAEKQG